MRDAVRGMYTPFPEEEVGKGAKWEVLAKIPLSGAIMEVRSIYTLLRVSDADAQANVEMTLSAPPHQPMQNPALPPGATSSLEELSGKGSAKITPRFERLASAGQSQVSSKTVLDVTAGNEKAQVSVLTDVTMVVRAADAKPAPAKK
jgi:hypothetical protein